METALWSRETWQTSEIFESSVMQEAQKIPKRDA
jgi:hypothetical protein